VSTASKGTRLTIPAPVPGIGTLAALVADSRVVVPTGAGTHREVGGPTPDGTAVRASSGIVAYDPAELTVTVLAGTSVADLTTALAVAGQECPLDPRDGAATVGGVIASGLSGHRRLRYGPLRDTVLEVRLVMADGSLVRGGAPVVKNVTGYDLPRLIVGSLGTLAVIAQATLRCRPLPATTAWTAVEAPPEQVRAHVFAPSSLLWDGAKTHLLLEGNERDVDVQLAAVAALDRETAGPSASNAPEWPAGAHRGRISIRPGAVIELGHTLDTLARCRWIAEAGVGTVHVATDTPEALTAARAAAHTEGGWLLREAGGGTGFDGFGRELPDLPIARRLKHAFDPTGKLSPGRLPL
jgi:glycolate oxidase FAD binding subunit